VIHVPVETPRLLLRVPQPGDAQPFLAIHQDPEVIARKQVTLIEPPGGIDMALRNIDRMLRHWQTRGYGQWAVVEKATGAVIGCVGFYHPDRWPGIDLSWIIERSRWGNGLATEASRAALEWAWETENIDHVISLIAPSDLRSIRVATKIGESFERADTDPINGEPIHVYGVHAPERPSASRPKT
jgi:RimJ/RimL family protein N-acetyltransferase